MRGVHLAHIASGLFFAVAGLWAAGQFCAWTFQYSHLLGTPLFRLGPHAVYWPWQWLLWMQRFDGQAPAVFWEAIGITFASVVLSFLTLVAQASLRAKRAKEEDRGSYGSARWAKTDELRESGLLGGAGVVLCQTDDAELAAEFDPKRRERKLVLKRAGELIQHDGPEHVFVFAPTRSGKGVGIVIPTLVSWPHSVLVYDIKKELWDETAGWRRKFSHCLRLEPTAADSVRYNPLLEVRRGRGEVRDVQNIAEILINPDGTKEPDHWSLTAGELLTGTILHVLYAEPDKSLAGLDAFLSDPDRDTPTMLEHMLRYPHLGSAGPHPIVARVARSMLNKGDKELAGVVSTAITALSLYRDPIIAENTRASDFRIRDLVDAESPTSLYLVVSPSDIARLKPFLRLVVAQIGNVLTEKLEKDRKHRLLILLDEFPSLGKLSFLETQIPYFAGYKLKMLLIAQDLGQLERIYGPASSILANSHVRLTYGANDDKTAKRISELLGTATETRIQQNVSGGRLDPWLKNLSESQQEHARPLLTPGEILQLPSTDALLMVGGLSPYRAKKVLFFADPRFKGRPGLPPPNSADEQRRELPPRRRHDWTASPGRPPPTAPSSPGLAPTAPPPPSSAATGAALGAVTAAALASAAASTSEGGSSLDDDFDALFETPAHGEGAEADDPAPDEHAAAALSADPEASARDGEDDDDDDGAGGDDEDTGFPL